MRSLVGSGVYVREQASLPGPEDAEHPLAGAAAFLFEMGQLKNQPRSGWQLLGISRPESERYSRLRSEFMRAMRTKLARDSLFQDVP